MEERFPCQSHKLKTLVRIQLPLPRMTRTSHQSSTLHTHRTKALRDFLRPMYQRGGHRGTGIQNEVRNRRRSLLEQLLALRRLKTSEALWSKRLGRRPLKAENVGSNPISASCVRGLSGVRLPVVIRADTGSNPVGHPTSRHCRLTVRMPDFQTGRCGFESRRCFHFNDG